MYLEENIAKILNIRSSDFNTATGLIVEYKNYYLFSVQNEEKWREDNGINSIGIVGIGGGREGNESIETCLLRECREEINETLAIIDERTTICVKEDMSLSVVHDDLSFLSKAPFAISVAKNVAHNYHKKPFTVVFSYRTIIDHIPAICDIYGFVLCPKDKIHRISTNGMFYQDWINLGCQFITKGDLTRNSKLIPFGTFKSFISLKAKQYTV